MKLRYTINLLGFILAGCGGGGSSSPTVPVAVTAAKNPVLLSYTSNRVQVAFPNPASVPDGTQVVFTTSSPNLSLLPAATTTTTNGSATIRVKSSATGKFLITATGTVGSTVYTGSTFVTFISQPSSVRLSIALQPVVSNLGSLQFTILNDPGISVFQNFTSHNPGFTVITNPPPGQAPPGNMTTVGAVSANGVTITSPSPLFELTYGIGTNGGLPGFSIDPASVNAFTIDNAILPAPTFLLTWKYDTDTF